ncbi:MAG: hypothetical protein SFT90_01980 [Rickettsiales bacterium]|nr:hypothetical protein [Rickettsiales bacterium]
MNNFSEVVKALQNAGENLTASWAENLKISSFSASDFKIEVTKPVDFSIITQKEFLEKLRQVTNQNWQVIYIDEIEAKSDAISINQQKILEIENRKKQAINSDAIQNILKEFEGAEIISVVA